MEVFWGTTPDLTMTKHLRCRKHEIAGGWLARFWKAAWDGDKWRADCPFTPTIYASWLIVPEIARDFRERPDLPDRVVFYGGNLAGVSDLVRPPGHAPLPAVYVHAMALDNLLTLGARYKRESVHTALGELTPHDLQYGVILILQWPLLWGTLWAYQQGVGRLAGVAYWAGRVLAPALPVVGILLCYQGRYVAGGLLYFLAVGAVHGTHRGRPGRAAEVTVGVGCWVIYVIVGTGIASLATVVQFRVLDLTAGNWLEAVLESIIGRHVAERLAEWWVHR